MSEKLKMPELPLNGVVVSRTVLKYDEGGKPAVESLLICPDDLPDGVTPPIICQTIYLNGNAEPSAHLRVGHQVKVRRLYETNGYFAVAELTFDTRQFLPKQKSD